ncbi:hypothetical protein C8Q77DRAFT_841886 [Trametes polyzona]|nr:hypothetical protein C8Q77DRAFT_841886 [Trametes polyzona]
MTEMASVETQTELPNRQDVGVQTLPCPGPPGPSRDTPPITVLDNELWFDDGNLVFEARDVQFRVYKGTLMAHATVLRDILSATHPNIPPELDMGYRTASFGGEMRTILCVSESPHELRHFLRLFFSGESLNIWAREPTIHQLSAYIRLGLKYGCAQAVDLSLGYLKKWYTDTRDAWFRVSQLDPPRFEPAHVIGVVNLARAAGPAGAPIVPSALMVCCQLGAELVTGYAREDGTRETLAPDDLGRVFAAKARLLQANVRATHRVFAQVVSPSCKRSKTCAAVIARLLGKLVDDETVIDSFRWSSLWETYINKVDTEGEEERRQLCTHCYRMVTWSRPEDFQRELFSDLPSMMGVTVENWAGKMAS